MFPEILKAERIRRGWSQAYVGEQLEADFRVISTWERGLHLPTAYYRPRLCALFQMTLEELGLVCASNERDSMIGISSALPSPDHVLTVPSPRNPFFTGREDILTRLATTLCTDRAIALTQPQAVSGLGGVGKTQLAAEYAYRFQDRYQAILWAGADSHEGLVTAYMQFAAALDLPEQTERDQNQVVTAVQRWLRGHRDWLLILDNVEDLGLLGAFLPPSYQGHVLLTTRMHVTEPVALSLELESLSDEEGALLLLRRTKRLALNALLDATTAEERLQALAISRTLGGLPLALDQAGAYILETGCALSDYLPLYERGRAALLSRRGSIPAEHPQSVATTFSLAIERAQQKNPAAVELLKLCSFLAPDEIPEALLTGGAVPVGPILQPVVADPFAFNEATEALQSLSLIHRHAERKTLRLHRLVQAALRDGMSTKMRKQWIKRAIRVINTAFPIAMFSNWGACERCLPHALMCALWIEQERLVFPEAARLLHKVGCYLEERAQDKQAQTLLLSSLAINEKLLGATHPEIATCLDDLATIYRRQGDFEEAEALWRRALNIREGTLGANHPETATSLNHLARLYRNRGKFIEAESLLRRALALTEQVSGPEHVQTALSLRNLARLYCDQGRHTEAEPLLVRALTIREEVLKPEHSAIAENLIDLARLYCDQGKYKQTEAYCQRALAIYEQVCGPESPYTATVWDMLARLSLRQGTYEIGQNFCQRAIAIYERVLGSHHPYTLGARSILARLYCHQEKYEEAEALFLHVLPLMDQFPEDRHRDQIDTVKDYLILLRQTNRGVEAARVELAFSK